MYFKCFSDRISIVKKSRSSKAKTATQPLKYHDQTKAVPVQNDFASQWGFKPCLFLLFVFNQSFTTLFISLRSSQFFFTYLAAC